MEGGTMSSVTPRPALSALLGVDETGGGRPPQPTSWRERLVSQAAELTRSGGWQAITMAKLADRVGVSRQTVYNEIGSKRQLAEAMIMHELEVFLRAVDAAFEEHRIDPLVDMVIRLVLSHVTAPSTSPRETADNIAWIAEQVLARR